MARAILRWRRGRNVGHEAIETPAPHNMHIGAAMQNMGSWVVGEGTNVIHSNFCPGFVRHLREAPSGYSRPRAAEVKQWKFPVGLPGMAM